MIYSPADENSHALGPFMERLADYVSESNGLRIAEFNGL
jgi:hypothetical protein